jgi:hypothetical protein
MNSAGEKGKKNDVGKSDSKGNARIPKQISRHFLVTVIKLSRGEQ